MQRITRFGPHRYLPGESVLISPSAGASLDGAYRDITIDSTNIDADLTDYPLPLIIGTSSGQTNVDLSGILDTDSSKIHVHDSNGFNCKIEIQRWDAVNDIGILWVKVPSISSSQDTTIRIYYDSDLSGNTEIGAVGSANGISVFSSYYKHVWHMETADFAVDASDSVGTQDLNSTNGTAGPSKITGGVMGGNCLDFSTSDTERKYAGSGIFDFEDQTLITLEGWHKPTTLPNTFNTILMLGNATGSADSTGIRFNNDYAEFMVVLQSTARTVVFPTIATADNWYHVAGRWSGTGTVIDVYQNGVKQAGVTEYNQAGIDRTTVSACAGNTRYATGRGVNGPVNELRIANLALTDAFLKANYYSQADNILTWGAEAGV